MWPTLAQQNWCFASASGACVAPDRPGTLRTSTSAQPGCATLAALPVASVRNRIVPVPDVVRNLLQDHHQWQ